MAIRKSELYSSLWKSCDELRGGMDASQYKDYVLALLFMKYVSDKYAGQSSALLEVPGDGGFVDMVALKGDKEIGDKINKIFGKLVAANEGLEGIAFPDFNDDDKLGRGKEMVDRLSNLVAIFDTPALDFRANNVEGDDLLGDAYEYLMRHFATESGKSKGQFYTPAEVSRTMAMVADLASAKSSDQTIYDPTCGSGSLLLRAHAEAKRRAGLDLAIYGQEMDNATAGLAKMNMVLHDCLTAEIWQSNSLSAPHFTAGDRLKTFDFVVANFPFSNKAWSNGLDPAHDRYHRFEYGIPPAKNGDYAFLLHILASLKSTGKGAVVHPHGVLFRGGAEGDIRKELIRRGFIKGVIGLPPNLFYGTSIPACILVLDKENAAARKGIFMIDASKGFVKDGNKNRLRERDIHKIVDVFTRQLEVPKYSRIVPLAEISDPRNDYNLNIPRYIDTSEPEDVQDINAHLHGGIPESDISDLERFWSVLPSLREKLFEPADRPGYLQLRVPALEVKAVITSDAAFRGYGALVTAAFAKWRAANEPRLDGIAIGERPKELIASLSEDLLDAFRAVELIDPYAMYQHLMDYWNDIMQDDLYLIARSGWVEAAKPRLLIDEKSQKSKEESDFTIDRKKFRSDVIPAAFIIARYFAKEQEAIVTLEAERASLEQTLEVLREEHGGEDGLLESVMGEDGKISVKALQIRLQEVSKDHDAADEREVLTKYRAALESLAIVKELIKKQSAELNTKVASRYTNLTQAEIKDLVVRRKWLAHLYWAVESEVESLARILGDRVRELAERYATPLPEIEDEVGVIRARVADHLKVLDKSRS